MWQQYWIYIKGQEDKDYFALLKEVVSPMLGYTGLDKFFFFRYLHDDMHYIRLRVEGLCSRSAVCSESRSDAPKVLFLGVRP